MEIIYQMYGDLISFGIEQCQNGNYDKGIECFTQLINNAPNYYYGYQLRAMAYSEKGDYNSAVIDYKHAIDLDLFNANLYNDLGVVYVNMDDYKSAISCFSAAIEICSDDPDPDLYYNRGKIYLESGIYAKAIKDFLQVKKIDKNYEGLEKELAKANFLEASRIASKMKLVTPSCKNGRSM